MRRIHGKAVKSLDSSIRLVDYILEEVTFDIKCGPVLVKVTPGQYTSKLLMENQKRDRVS